MSSPRLQGRRVLVAGGVTGIGRAVCLRLASEGAFVWINYHSRREAADEVRAAVLALGGGAELLRADITNPDAVRLMLDMALAGGSLHSLVHSASAPLTDKKFRATSWEDFQRHWEVGVKGAYNLAHSLLNRLEPAGLESIVFLLSSVTLGSPPVEKSAYNSAKYALLGLARTLALELASRGVRVNCVSPGFTETPLTAGVDPRLKEMIMRATPLKKLCSPEDAAAAVAFLLSSDSASITGANLPVAGGAAM